MPLVQEMKSLAKLAIDHGGQRDVLRREYFFRLAKRFTPLLAVEDDGVRFLVSTADDVIGRVTYMYRGFDERAMHRLVDQLATETGRREPLRGRAILDVGGNIGTTSIYAVTRFGARHADAFEPAPANLELLRQNVALNSLQDRITVHDVALSDSNGSVSFELSPESGGDHRVRVGDGAPGEMGEAARTTVDVEARRLDALVEQGDVALDDVALVWMDVQGHEGHVLGGAGAVLDAGIPVCLEYWPYGLQRAGGLDGLHETIAGHFSTVVDMGHPFEDQAPRRLPAGEIAGLAGQYTGSGGTTDLLLVP